MADRDSNLQNKLYPFKSSTPTIWIMLIICFLDAGQVVYSLSYNIRKKNG